MTKFRIEGLSEINRALGQLPKATGRAALVRVGKRRLEPLLATAKAAVPVEEGELRDSLIISTQQGTHGQRKRRFADRSTVEVMMGPSGDQHGHAVPQEFGSINNPPAGYMRKAWDQHNAGMLNGIADDLGETVTKAARRHSARMARKKG
jgi:hypothetical protein